MTPWRAITARARHPRKRKKRRALFTCGRCGKSYSSPLGHACTGGGDFAKRRRGLQRAGATRQRQAAAAATRQRERNKVSAARQAERDKAATRVAAARRAERARADARVARAKGGRPPAARRPQATHGYRSCREDDCQRPACEAWREGVAEGREAGFEDGFEAGAAAASREG